MDATRKPAITVVPCDRLPTSSSYAQRSARIRAVVLDLLIILLSLPVSYLQLKARGEVVSWEEFRASLVWTLPLTFALIVGRRLLQARARGKVTDYDYDYEAMNPTGFFKVEDMLSPVPHISWDRHPGKEAFFEAVLDHDRFNDTPGLAVNIRRPGDVTGAMSALQWFQPAAVLWE